MNSHTLLDRVEMLYALEGQAQVIFLAKIEYYFDLKHSLNLS